MPRAVTRGRGFGRVRRACRKPRGGPAQCEGREAIQQQRSSEHQGKLPRDVEREAAVGRVVDHPRDPVPQQIQIGHGAQRGGRVLGDALRPSGQAGT